LKKEKDQLTKEFTEKTNLIRETCAAQKILNENVISDLRTQVQTLTDQLFNTKEDLK